MAFALHQVSDSDEMYQVFAEWSQVDYPNYDESATDNLWAHAKDDREDGITFGTLIHWAKEADPDGYEEWKKTWNDKQWKKLKYLINNFDHSECGKYFHHIKPNNFVFKDNQGWWILQDNNRWRQSENATGFINIVCNVLKAELARLRNHYVGKQNVINEAYRK